MITNRGDISSALEVTEDWVEKHANDEVRTWVLQDSKTASMDEIEVTVNIGFVKWATILSFYHLRQESSYQDAIRETVSLGGDTDTNAAIVGGMLGAYHRVDGIPKLMREKVTRYQYRAEDNYGYTRPDFVSPSYIEYLVRSLFKISEFDENSPE